MSDEKYIVFKREVWGRFIGTRPVEDQPPTVDDAVVIRTQDVFAAAGLSAYAHNIECAMMFVYDMEELAKVRDYFRSVAQEAEDRLARGECKLPD